MFIARCKPPTRAHVLQEHCSMGETDIHANCLSEYYAV